MPHMKYCSHCKKERPESEFVEKGISFKICNTCRESMKRQKREVRTKAKKEKETQREEEIAERVAQGDLNYGLPKAKKVFMSWEDYKGHFKNAKFATYLREKSDWEAKENEPKDEDEALISYVPLTSDDCLTVRRMMLGLDKKDSLFVGIHHSHCESCQKFYSLVYGGKIQGVNLWDSPIG